MNMMRIFTHGTNSFEIEGLSVEYVFCESFFQHLHKVFIASPAGETRFPSTFTKYIRKVNADGKSSTSCTCLEGEPVVEYPCFITELSGPFSEEQAVWAL